MNTEGWQEKCDSFLPNEWRFGTSRRGLYVDWERETVFLPVDFDFTDENVLGLMHEVGHACLDTQRTEEELEYECRLRDKASMGFVVLDEHEREEYKRIVIAEETKAWNFVLERLEGLKEAGLLSLNLDMDFVYGVVKRKLDTYRKMIES